MVTLGNFLCGFAAIWFVIRALAPGSGVEPLVDWGQNDLFVLSAWLILLAMVFDFLDGAVARLTKTESAFGAEMDSLADVVSFGIAPALLVLAICHDAHIATKGTAVVAGLYAVFAALRLARYNVESGTIRPETKDKMASKEYFHGLPSPAAAGVLATLILFHYKIVGAGSEEYFVYRLQGFLKTYSRQDLILVLIQIIMLLIGLLMVSRIKFLHLGNTLLKQRKSFSHLVILVGIVCIFLMKPEHVLAVGFTGYVLVGCVLGLRRMLVDRRALLEEEEEDDDEEFDAGEAP